MFALILVPCLSLVSSSIFLRTEKKNVILTAFIALGLGSALFLYHNPFVTAAGLFIGLLCFSVCEALKEKRPWIDGFLLFCLGGGQIRLWITFQNMLQKICNDHMVLSLYVCFYMLHIPAVLLSFDRLCIPRNRNREGNPKGEPLIFASGLLALLLPGAASFLPAAGLPEAIVITLLATAVFWMALALLVLVVAYGQKREQSTAESSYYHEMNTFMNVVRSQRHDYNLHVQTVASLIAQNKWEECRTYVNALVQDTNELNTVLTVKDPAVAAMLHNFRIRAAQAGISIDLTICNDMALVVTNAYETNKIIGNLLQNALDEVAAHREKSPIELSIVKRGEFCLVCVSNRIREKSSFTETREEIFRQGFTTKQGHDGVGLSSIKALTQQVGGDVTAWLEEDRVHFVASIPMHLELE